MTDETPPIGRGDFVWTLFPTSEEPTEPSENRHIALCLRRFVHANKGHLLVAVYTTTSRPFRSP